MVLICICVGLVVNISTIVGLSLFILAKIRKGNAKCLDENRSEREAMGVEYKGLAQQTVEALIKISVAVSNLSERLPPHTGTTRIMTHVDGLSDGR
jgi:hypothetical protein